MPLDWHEDCLGNNKDSLKRKEEELLRLHVGNLLLQAEIRFYEQQIALARSKGKGGFDRNRFGYDTRLKETSECGP